jgi:hypothetical protein
MPNTPLGIFVLYTIKNVYNKGGCWAFFESTEQKKNSILVFFCIIQGGDVTNGNDANHF